MKKLLLAALSILVSTGVAAADTIQFGAAELTTPDDGWSVSDDDRMLTLGLEAGGAFIEVYNFSKAPAADRTALATLVGGRKETTEVAITSAGAHGQHGLKGIAFRGAAKIRGKAVEISGVALDGIAGRAIVVIAFNVPSLAKGHKQDVAGILASARRGK